MHPPPALEQPLPAELTGRSHGWLTRYRRYPVFSRLWTRGRARTLVAVLLPTYLLLMVPPLAAVADDGFPLGALTQVAFQLFAPVFIGHRLGMAVRRRGLPEAAEGRVLAAAMVATALLVLAFHAWGADPLKQWLAEATGRVDASGKRKQMALSIGVTVSNPDRAGAAPSIPPALEATGRVLNGSVSLLLSFWLAGGAALWGWRRERDGLRAIARERELAAAQARQREAELRLSVLAAQVEPHFLFNTLAGVRSAVATDPARASEMIDHLVEYLRAAIPRLRSDGSLQATVGAQLEIVRAYLALMSSRMRRLTYRIDAPADLLAARCPPLMLISLVENAVKHGVEPKIGPAAVEVRAERDDAGNLVLRVLDDGVGFGNAGSGSGIGLSNLQARLEQLFPGRAALTLKARTDGGVEATITLPLEFDDLR